MSSASRKKVAEPGRICSNVVSERSGTIYRNRMPIPSDPKIYHITHVDNLPNIIDGKIWSDAERVRRNLNCTLIGMSEIKRRRLEELEVDCHPGTRVGEYVPFYFCPRSVMLYILHMGNSPGLTYTGGQKPIVHLRADLAAVIQWANTKKKRWAFSTGNAGAYFAEFYDRASKLDKVDWDSVAANDWRNPDVKEGKQAEFLVEHSFPWHLFEMIGVKDQDIARRVKTLLSTAKHRPHVDIKPGWYY